MTRLIATFMVLLAAISPASALAQQGKTTVRAQLSSEQAYVGDGVDLNIVVEGSAGPERPKLNLPEGLRGEFVGGGSTSQSSVIIINGRRMDNSAPSYTFQYRLTPTRAGEYKIPPIDVVVDGQTYHTRALSLSVVVPPRSDATRLRLDVEKRDLYVGEATTLRLEWLITSDVRNFRFSDLTGSDAFDLSNPRDRTPTGRSQDPSVREFSLFGRTVVATIDQTLVDGRQFTRITVEQVLVPKEPGRHELGPLSVALDLVVGRRQSTLFDSLFDDNAMTKRAVAMSEPVTVDVKPLPESGRPPGFAGLVGEYSIAAQAQPTEIGVGDPITLTVTIDGSETPADLGAPSLEDIPGFTDSFKLSPEGWTAGASPRGGRQFTTTVRATNASVSEVPPVAISSFDPSSERYVVSRSEPIPLKVRATRTVTAADAIGAVGIPAPSPAGLLRSAIPGLPANDESHDTLRDEGAHLSDRLRTPTVVAALALPVATYFAFAGVLAFRSKRHGAAPRVGPALRKARRRLARATDAPAIGDAIRSYVAHVTGRPVSTLTGEDCAALLRKAGAETSGQIGSLLSECDARRFGGPEADPKTLRARALGLLDGLQIDLRRMS